MATNSQNPAMGTAKGNATTSQAQLNGSTSTSANAPKGVSRSTSNSSTSKRSQFRQQVGIPDAGKPHPGQTLQSCLERAYTNQTRYYYFVATLSHGMLWLQIAIGATLTALGSTNSDAVRVAIVVLGAINTLVAGLLTFLKSRNQPNRALQFRNGLRSVYEDLYQVDAESGRSDFDVDKKVDYLWAKYKETRQEAEANYPDLWVSLNKMIKSHDSDKQPSTQLDQTDSPPGAAPENHPSEAHEPLLAHPEAR